MQYIHIYILYIVRCCVECFRMYFCPRIEELGRGFLRLLGDPRFVQHLISVFFPSLLVSPPFSLPSVHYYYSLALTEAKKNYSLVFSYSDLPPSLLIMPVVFWKEQQNPAQSTVLTLVQSPMFVSANNLIPKGFMPT